MTRGISGAIRAALMLMGMAAAVQPDAASAAQRSARADASIVAPLTLIKDEDLDFGALIPSASAGIVVVPPSGARTSTGGIILVGSTYAPARFAGFGRQNQNVQISVGSNTITITRVGGGATMTVNTWVIGSTPTATLTTNPRVFTITSPTGIFNFPVGARLNVGANQLPGTYTGTFTLTLNYQ